MVRIYIDGEEVIANQEFTIKEEMQNTSSTVLNNCYPATWEATKDYVSNFYYPKDYSLCTIYQDDALIFAGIVENSGNISLSPFQPKYCSLQILGFETLLSEGETLDFVISNKTIEQALEEIIDAISDYGFVKGNVSISDTTTIGAYSTQEKTAYDVLGYLSDISGTRWFTRLENENAVAIDMYNPELLPSGTKIEYTKEWFNNNNIIDISFSYSSRDYRNKQVITSDQVLAGTSYDEVYYADGYNTTYNTSLEIAQLNSITIDGTQATFATTAEKELGVTADFYYEQGKTELTSEDTLTVGQAVAINYIPYVQGRQVVTNSDEISRIEANLNRKGTIARYENRNDTTSSDELYKIGQTYLKFKGNPEVELTIQTLNNIWSIGEVVEFDAPLEELTTSYMVKSREIRIIASIDKIFYTYKLSSSFNSEQAINYFDNQRSKNAGNIGEGEFVTRNIDIAAEGNIIFDDLTISEIAYTNNNILDSSLESTFVK